MSEEPELIGREMAMVHRFFRREFLLAADVVRECGDGDRVRADVVPPICAC